MRRPHALGLAAVLVLALAACGRSPQRVEAPAVGAVGERLVLAERTVADLKPVAALVTTKDMAEARARIGGTLVRLTVKEGDEVRKGQVVAVVTDQRLALETRAYRAQAAAAAAEATRARADLGRIQTLYEKGVYAKARLEQAQAAASAAQSQLDAVRAQGAAAAELERQGEVLAPASGRVLRADAPAGSVVGPGQSVATITAGEPLLRLEIPEAQAHALKVGDSVAIVAEDLPGVAPSGLIEQVYPAVASGQVVADIRVAGLGSGLVGQRVRVLVKVGARQALMIPRRFVATRYGVDFVRVAGRDGGAADVAVQVAAGPAADEVEVLSGLGRGDVIVAPTRARTQGGTR